MSLTPKKLSFSQYPTAMIRHWPLLGSNKLPHPRVRHVLRETQRREERDEHLRDGGSSSGEEFEAVLTAGKKVNKLNPGIPTTRKIFEGIIENPWHISDFIKNNRD